MSFELLLENAKELVNNPNELKRTQADIRQMQLREIELSSEQFHNLVFMLAPREENWKMRYPLRDLLCGKTLKTNVKNIRHKGNSPIEIFHELSKKDNWFKHYFVISARFDPRLMGNLWIRDLKLAEKKQDINGSFFWACLVQDVKLTGLLPPRNHHVDNNLSFFFTFFGKLNILLA